MSTNEAERHGAERDEAQSENPMDRGSRGERQRRMPSAAHCRSSPFACTRRPTPQTATAPALDRAASRPAAVQRLQPAGAGVHLKRAVGLEHQQARGLGEDGAQAALHVTVRRPLRRCMGSASYARGRTGHTGAVRHRGRAMRHRRPPDFVRLAIFVAFALGLPPLGPIGVVIATSFVAIALVPARLIRADRRGRRTRSR